MNAKELAAKLNGREYLSEITKEEAGEANAAGLVVVFGASDDLIEFRGALDEEINAWEGVTAYLTSDGLLYNLCRDRDCPYHAVERKYATTIEAKWDSDGYSWTYETAIPHETFEIVEGDEKYCRGIVFALVDVKGGE